ncbi:hypothetical protein R3P38DRAFT_2799765 [Favolaschia claudopus]|uniref:DUF6534 domain-containing protein n=1 Tax=Favolaschia claudopus TaxID=2862362 RepID=A0AAV9ZYX4_9AGAR
MYHMSVTNFGDYAQFGRYPPWSLKIPVGGISASLVQFFYAYRIYMLSQKSLVFPVPIFVCALGAFGISIVIAGNLFMQHFSVGTYSLAMIAVQLAADIIISTGMLYYLLRNKSQVFIRTKKAVNTLAVQALNTGVFTLVFGLADIVVTHLFSMNLNQLPLFFVLVRLYTLSLLSILNSREHVREQLANPSHATVTLPSYLNRSTGISHELEIRNQVSTLEDGESNISVLENMKPRSERC